MKKISLFASGIFITFSLLLFPVITFSQTANVENSLPAKTIFPFDTDTALLFIAITLAFVIIILVGVLRSAIRFHFNSKKITETIKFFLTGIMITMSLQFANAQESNQLKKLDQQFVFSNQGWFLLLVVALELYILFSLTKWLKHFTGITNFESTLVKPQNNVWDKINAFKPIESEASIDVGHDYDGIRELDNVTPPWFIAAFVGSILFAAVYLYRYQISDSAPTQIKEYELSMKEAALQQQENLKHQANLIDENSVTLLKEGDYEEGKSIFKLTCAVCHGDKGQGLVGPNMTDDYWLHGGSVKDIFTTIKYGVLDKGMKSWKDDYSPNQIAQLASYIKSLKGTNPPEPKAPQGELYKEELIPPTPTEDTLKKKKP